MDSPPSSSHTTHAGFPIIAVAIIGILATGFLLVGYYVFVIKCCLNWHRIDLLRRFSLSGRRRGEDGRLIDHHSAAAVANGLDEAAIRAIPVLPYRKWKQIGEVSDQRDACEIECAVCLNEFQEEEKLRVIPDCAHIFHVDCIDVWLQNNANCPLCRRSISSYPTNQLLAPISESPNSSRDQFTGRDEDYVVIEITPERSNSMSSSAPRKLEQKVSVSDKNSRKKKKMSHEWIDIRLPTDEQFSVQPIRRSFSMDSASDPHLHLAVQEIIKKHQQEQQEGCSSRLKRSFFSFGNGRSTSRSAVLPLQMEP